MLLQLIATLPRGRCQLQGVYHKNWVYICQVLTIEAWCRVYLWENAQMDRKNAEDLSWAANTALYPRQGSHLLRGVVLRWVVRGTPSFVRGARGGGGGACAPRPPK